MKLAIKALSTLLLFAPITALAAVEITNIVYDVEGADEGREWLEVTNKGGEAVDISKFKLLEAGVNHKLTIAAGSAVLAPGTSAVITQSPPTFLSEHSGFAKAVFKSSFSLSNTGETLAILNSKGGVEHTKTYVAAEKPPSPKPTAKKTSTSSKKLATSSASVEAASLPPPASQTHALLPWLLGLGGVMALGVAGVLFIPSQIGRVGETKRESDEFELEN